jgi:hypothetical protein
MIGFALPFLAAYALALLLRLALMMLSDARHRKQLRIRYRQR